MTVLVVGSLHLDVVLRAPHLPRLGETVAGSAVRYVFGGKGGNQAVATARLGAKVGFAGRAGTDGFGDLLRDELIAHGIDITQLQRDTGPSGMSAAIIEAGGDYGAVIVSAANLNIEAERITIPTQTALVLLQNEIPESVNIAVARKAKAMGAHVWLNAAPARHLPDALMPLIDLLIVNEVEAAFYGTLPSDLDLLTTLGAEGVVYRGETWPARKADVISTHGAGDMFIGALAARVIAGASIAAAIPFAQAAAAWHIGTAPQVRDATDGAALMALLNGQLKP